MKNLSSSTKMTRHSVAVIAGATTITPAAGINMAGYEGCLFIAEMGTITAGAATSIEIHQSSDDGAGDSYGAILGSKVTIPDTGSNKCYYVDVVRPGKQWLKCIVNRATQNSVLDSILAIQYNSAVRPPTHDTSIGAGEIHVEKAEGTA